MQLTSKFGKPFLMLLLILPILTGISIYLYQEYQQTTDEIHQIIYNDLLEKKAKLFQNFSEHIHKELGDEMVLMLQKNPDLRHHYENEMSLLITRELKYLYMLYYDYEDKKLRYLLDSSQDEEERAEYGQKFDPQTDIWEVARITRQPQVEQQEVDTLWITYALPIIVNGKIVALLGADFSNDESRYIDEAVIPLKNLYFYISIFMIIMLVTAYVQFIMYYLSRKRSLHDPLTRTYNRQYLAELLNNDNIDQYQMLLIDLDHFKRINDIYGHDVGDIVLQAASGRIKSQIRDQDVLIRYGGEEFLLLLKEKSVVTCKSIADRIQEGIKERPIKANEHNITLTLSIGINPYPGYAKNIDEAIKIADEQLYRAKSSGRDRVEISNDEKLSLQSNTTKRIQDVKTAILEERIHCVYQPMFKTDDLSLKKFEVLVRLLEQDGTVVTPDDFLPAIANTQAYIKVTERVLSIALQTLKEKPVELSINLALQDVFNNDIMAMITSLLMSNSDLTNRLTFEILETAEITNFDLIRQRIDLLKSLGVKIALDDFGSGYANFKYLVHLGIDILKIDGSLIRDIDTNDNAYHIVQTINDFAKRMDIITVAEQIETEQELETVKELEIDYVQGYYLGKPSFDLFDLLNKAD
ncbi:MAG: EAL domain-containing protein [Campylobacterota bacterium]|nr:EAL domain-containing protein [Campylobacterota bacterium]